MTTEVIAQTLQAGVQATFGQGRVWYIKSATAALTIIAERQRTGANVRKFINVGAGFKFTAAEGDGWTYLRVTSAVAQAIEIIIGDDDVEVANAVTVSGGVSVQAVPSSVWLSTQQTVANTNKQSIAANATRRRITFTNPSTNAGSVFIQQAALGAGFGIELQPGTFLTCETIAALDIRNDSGGALTINVDEES